jgi:hypothetical protein
MSGRKHRSIVGKKMQNIKEWHEETSSTNELQQMQAYSHHMCLGLAKGYSLDKTLDKNTSKESRFDNMVKSINCIFSLTVCFVSCKYMYMHIHEHVLYKGHPPLCSEIKISPLKLKNEVTVISAVLMKEHVLTVFYE